MSDGVCDRDNHTTLNTTTANCRHSHCRHQHRRHGDGDGDDNDGGCGLSVTVAVSFRWLSSISSISPLYWQGERELGGGGGEIHMHFD